MNIQNVVDDVEHVVQVEDIVDTEEHESQVRDIEDTEQQNDGRFRILNKIALKLHFLYLVYFYDGYCWIGPNTVCNKQDPVQDEMDVLLDQTNEGLGS